MKKYLLCVMLVLALLLFAACQQQPEVVEGPQGPAGPAGEPGPQGPPGEPASAIAAAPEFVGSEACGECHTDIFDTFMLSGHPYKLSPVVDGQPPEYPYTELPPEPPAGYTWDEVSYVIGGYNWKARFIDQDGFIITGDEDATTQYNFYNEVLDMGDNWVPYHAGEEKPYSCGTCHTTGYSAEGNQDGLPGLIGTWAAPGIQCEECHGAGSLHAESPIAVDMTVRRDAAACGDCHVRGSFEEIDASGGFIRHHESYEELFQSKHLVLDCVDCHDPHGGVIQYRQRGEDTTQTDCENCHFENARYQDNEVHQAINVECIDCHMPRITKSALGNPDIFTGDIRTHIMAIDPLQVEQFIETEDGATIAASQISLNFACRHCHNEEGTATPKTDEELQDTAINYHTPPTTETP